MKTITLTFNLPDAPVSRSNTYSAASVKLDLPGDAGYALGALLAAVPPDGYHRPGQPLVDFLNRVAEQIAFTA